MLLRTMFGILFATKDLSMTMDFYGRVSGICALLGALTALVSGRFIDRKGAITLYLHGSYSVIFISLAGYFFIRTPNTYAVIAILTTICYSIQSTAYTPLLVKIFPKHIYGQLSSANSTICSIMVMLGASIGGWLTGLLGYRIMFLWDVFFTTLATACLIVAIASSKQTTVHQTNTL